MPCANVLRFTNAAPGTSTLNGMTSERSWSWGGSSSEDRSQHWKEAEGGNHFPQRATPSPMEIFHCSQECQNPRSDKSIQRVHSGPAQQPSFVQDPRDKCLSFTIPPPQKPYAFSMILSVPLHQHYQEQALKMQILAATRRLLNQNLGDPYPESVFLSALRSENHWARLRSVVWLLFPSVLPQQQSCPLFSCSGPQTWNWDPAGPRIRDPFPSNHLLGLGWSNFLNVFGHEYGLFFRPGHLRLCLLCPVDLPHTQPPWVLLDSPSPLTPGCPTFWDEGYPCFVGNRLTFVIGIFFGHPSFYPCHNFHSSLECQNLCSDKYIQRLHSGQGPLMAKCVKWGVCFQHLSTSRMTSALYPDKR